MYASTVFFCGAPSFRKTRGVLTIFQRMIFLTTGCGSEILATNGLARWYWSGMNLAILHSSAIRKIAIRRILRCCSQAVPASFLIPSSLRGCPGAFQRPLDSSFLLLFG